MSHRRLLHGTLIRKWNLVRWRFVLTVWCFKFSHEKTRMTRMSVQLCRAVSRQNLHSDAKIWDTDVENHNFDARHNLKASGQIDNHWMQIQVWALPLFTGGVYSCTPIASARRQGDSTFTHKGGLHKHLRGTPQTQKEDSTNTQEGNLTNT